MPYASVTHVDALDTGRPAFNATSLPNVTQVAQFLTDTAAELDAILTSKGYAVPVPTTSPQSFALLVQYNSYGGHALSQQAAQNAPKRDDAWEMWQSALKMLKEIELPDYSTQTTGSRMRFSESDPIFDISQASAYSF